MARRGLATAASIALHGAVIALALLSWPSRQEEREITISSVPVSIVSDVEIAAAPADNPSDELVEAETVPNPAPTPPEPTPPEPTPPPPTPRPRPAPPEKARPTPPRPTPPRPAPPRPTPPREAPGLDLGALAGPPRKAPPDRRPTGERGQGQAPRATGAQITAIFSQVYPNWNLGPTCSIPGGDQLRITMDVTLSPSGRITSGPTLVSPRSDAVYRAAADEAIRALRQTAPFTVPEGFPGGPYQPTFNTERACRGAR